METNSTFDAFVSVIANTSHEKYFEGGLMTSFAWSAASGIVTRKADEYRAYADQAEVSDEQKAFFDRTYAENLELLQWALPQIPVDSTYAPTPEMILARLIRLPSLELRPDQKLGITSSIEATLLPGEDAALELTIMTENVHADNLERYQRMQRFEAELFVDLTGAFTYARENPLDLSPDGFTPTAFMQRRMCGKVVEKAKARVRKIRSDMPNKFGEVKDRMGADIHVLGGVMVEANELLHDINRDIEASTEPVSDDIH